MIQQSSQASYIKLPHRALTGLRDQIKEILTHSGAIDPVANPVLLRHLSSYASIVAQQPLQCRWDDRHATDLVDTIMLNPYDPRGAPATDRKIVVDAALEHEVRGHWLHTPRSVFEAVCAMADGKSVEAQQPYWQNPAHVLRRYALRPLFNILEDGRVETRLRWEQPEAYKIIAAGDRIRPRWNVPPFYLPALKAHTRLLGQAKSKEQIRCVICNQTSTLQSVPCINCFTEQYRWEQISGLLLLAALPPHTPPLAVVEPVVQDVFQLCVPWVLHALGGTAHNAFESAQEVLKLLITEKMVSPIAQPSQLMVSDATGNSRIKDSKISKDSAQAAGLTVGDGHKEQASAQQFDHIAVRDLQNFDFRVGLNIDEARKQAQVALDIVETEQQIEATRMLVLSASGLGAGTGLGAAIQRTPQRADIYAHLRQMNLERGRRFAYEIQTLLSTVSQPTQFQRNGRLDRSQLVNATARNRQTVFTKTRTNHQFSLAISLLVDVSGSMAPWNRLINLNSYSSAVSAAEIQLADTVTTCIIGLERLNAAFEVRAFGSYQWLVKSFHEHNAAGIGGVPGLDNGGTAMLLAILYARLSLLSRTEDTQVMVVMTDGCPADPEKTSAQIRLARLQGIRVLGILFANGTEERTATEPAMASLFSPEGYKVVRSLEQFPQEVGRAIKAVVREQVNFTAQ